jgi:hypothetical protein
VVLGTRREQLDQHPLPHFLLESEDRLVLKQAVPGSARAIKKRSDRSAGWRRFRRVIHPVDASIL